ncbi:hypothetical protein EW146_g3827 [Bondarzewia mesenterica]|uniref:J domain-containing protein n=1 Tax=Bondarzewia mesenterica TaxID=1095465 RepID=A0A4S4LWX6_9AGAM|nr:hypothetical protein EW146_g3827 [Bondarzewia mesenterica]
MHRSALQVILHPPLRPRPHAPALPLLASHSAFLLRRHLHTPLPTLCPSCKAPLPTPLPACPRCFYIECLREPKPSFYEILDIPSEPNPFVIDTFKLQAKYRNVQRYIHPDTWASQGGKKMEIARNLSSLVNYAYRILLKPVDRIGYILRKQGVEESDTDKLDDKALIMEIMEAREALDESTGKETEKIRLENHEKFLQTIKELEGLVGSKDWENARRAAVRLKYLDGIEKAAHHDIDAMFYAFRHRLLMQLDPNQRLVGLPAVAPPPLKRPYASEAVVHSAPKYGTSEDSLKRPTKAPRVEKRQSSPSSMPPSPLPNPSTSHRSQRGHRAAKPFGILGPSSREKTPLLLSLPQPGHHIHDLTYIRQTHRLKDLKKHWEENPKSPLTDYAMNIGAKAPSYDAQMILIHGRQGWRVKAKIGDAPVVGIGDSITKKEAEQLAALSAVYQLNEIGVLTEQKTKAPEVEQKPQTTLSDGTTVTYEQARQFMDYYCRRYQFGKPDIVYEEIKRRKINGYWEAVMHVGGRRIGIGTGASKKTAHVNCYIDVTHYLESCDAELWKAFVEAAASGKDLGLAPRVFFQMSEGLEDEVTDLCSDIRKSALYQNRPAASIPAPVTTAAATSSFVRTWTVPQEHIVSKSQRLEERRKAYLEDPQLEKMRNTRKTLPVFTRSEEVLAHIRDNEVTVCMAATGSGKTTQIPQLILDEYIERGEGANCNIICTQPRRLAAISVAERVAAERGEVTGKGSVGYQVRFEAKLPEEHGSITFCTTGVFLKRMQSALLGGSLNRASLENVTHLIVDEVHERDVDTDLLLVVLKRLLADRRAKGKPIKVVLMSATIDPTLFREYFPDQKGNPAAVVDIPGRSFPVKKHFLEDFVHDLASNPVTRWVFAENSVFKYLHRELGPNAATLFNTQMGKASPQTSTSGDSSPAQNEQDLELPYPLIALTISHIIRQSSDGHVLVFLPGWEEISAVNRVIQERSLGINFMDTSKYSIHLLHSSIPLAEQQAIFEPPPPGVRRIILSTTIAETSVTIPDVVYVVDTAKIKEQRYDPQRHMSSLVTAWVGKSNLNQRAGRAGRHREGEYYGVLGRKRADELHTHQTVEMKRVDLTNVFMHVKALDFPGMAVEDVLAATIEPPAAERVAVAQQDLQVVGAIDENQNLTPLGRVLLQIPVDVQVGKLVLYGCFFRCLDQALTLAALLTNREPFVSPIHLKQQSTVIKDSWSPKDFKSDTLAALQAYNDWWDIQSKGEYVRANRFCMDNFLSKPTLLTIEKIRRHLLAALQDTGVFEVSAGGRVDVIGRGKNIRVPPALNANGDSLPLLAALITVAFQPKFAIRTGERSFRTQQDRMVFIHPSSVNKSKRGQEDGLTQADYTGKMIVAYSEKRQNISAVGATSSSAQTSLVTTTRLDPMTYVLFGAYRIAVTARGLECDDWLPIVGNIGALDDIQQLKTMMEGCMSRVFEGILMNQRRRHQLPTPAAPREEESGDEDGQTSIKDYRLASSEIKDLDYLTRDIVRILNRYAEERIRSQSRNSSRAATPMGSPFCSGEPPSVTTHSLDVLFVPSLISFSFHNGDQHAWAHAGAFIADIRGARVRDLEEKRINKEMANIRKKFKDGNLDGYQKKKYVAKVLYTYILGYKVDVGHMEAVNLISSHKYSEKQIGYLAVTLLMHENSDFLRLVINSIRKDLDEINEINNCLALHAIANVGGTEMAEALCEDVHRLLISPTSQSMVKKKAALTLLRLYRKHPDVIPAAEWALRIVAIMDDQDLGVVLCVTTLVMTLAQDHLEPYAVCYQKAVDRLNRLVVEHEYSSSYAYYKVPSPWLQVKLLRLLQYYPPSEDPTIRSTLHQVLETVMNNSAEQSRNMQHNNAQRAVLFEAIGLAIHLDTNSPLVTTSAILLARFISSKETNVRYLGLDTLAHLAARADSLDAIKKHQETVINSLRDRDISVRRRALDLLYSMCDVDNSEAIVGELLRYLRVADYALREEMVLKIAILTEKYASSYRWYVDTILELLSAAGDHVGDEVWYRVVQIVTNTEDLQAYAARVVFERLKSPASHESLVKVGGYILGEYGHIIANEDGYSPIDQLQVLHSKSQFCTAPTRALLLSTYIKWVNVFPEIKPQLINIFERYRHVLDSELQQRACEFYALASRPDDDELLQNVCEEIPPFPPRESTLLGRLNRKHGATEDKRVWVHGGKDANLDREVQKATRLPTGDVATNGVAMMGDEKDIMSSLAGLDLTSKSNGVSDGPGPLNPMSPSVAAGPSVERWFEKLTYGNEGVLYEDIQVQIGVKSRYQGHIGQLAIYIGNKISAPFTSFTTTIHVDDPEALSVTFAKMPPTMVPSRTQSQQILHVECKKVFKTPPIMTISFLAGSHQTIAIRLPVVLTKFFEPVSFGQADFFERWKLIGGPPREVQSVFTIPLTSAGEMDHARQRQIILGQRLNILSNVDPNPSNVVSAGVLHMSLDGKVGCLMRLEPNKEAKLCRITVRSTSEDVAGEVQRLIQKPLSTAAASGP